MLEKSLGLAKPSSWDVYFPGESYQTDDYRAQLVQQLVAYLSTDAGLHHLAKLTPVYPDGYELPLSYQHLKDGSNIPELQMALENQPRVALACISVAFAEVIPSSTSTTTTACIANQCLTSDHHHTHTTGCLWVSQRVACSTTQNPPPDAWPPALAADRLRGRLSLHCQTIVQGQPCW